MEKHHLVELALLVVLGVAAQWIGWRVKLPSILFLLGAGVLAGPVLGWVHPNALFGDLLLPLVSVCVALILFEGGLTLRFRELAAVRKVFWRLVTLGAAVTWGISALAAYYVLGMSWPVALLLGAILVVTGPTVIGPLLRHIRPTGKAGPLLKWEGIMIDPVGASLAVLVFEAIASGSGNAAGGVVAKGVLLTILTGAGLGVASAYVMVFTIRRYWIPEHLHVAISLALAVGAFAASNSIMPESGLLTVTVMGIWMANQNQVSIRHLVEFKENLRVLLLAVLFVLLAARLDLGLVRELGWRGIGFVAVLIFIARPLSILLCTWGTSMTWQERVFLGWMAPRGIVAAAVTSVFALYLREAGFAGAELMAPASFMVIGVTVLVYGLTAGPLAKKLGLALSDPQGAVIIGAHPLARQVGHVLDREGFDVLLVDSNWRNITAARQEGLKAHFGDALSEHLLDELPLDRMGRVLALTGNYTVNALAALHFAEVFGRAETYQLATETGHSRGQDETELPRHLRGRTLFGEDYPFRVLSERAWAGAKCKSTLLTENFRYAQFKEQNPEAVPMFVVTEERRLLILTAEKAPSPQPGHRLVYLS
ncbi:MAG: cation:proton antiporter [Candidatus Hydrogenedentes bacterium]|nr:cation:proton antiporter [Candidatus Hydrogenedentota bacterium]